MYEGMGATVPQQRSRADALDLRKSATPKDRRRQIASILARGVLRLRRKARIGEITHAQESQNLAKTGLELLGEKRLSVAHGTRGLRLRDEGDNA